MTMAQNTPVKLPRTGWKLMESSAAADSKARSKTRWGGVAGNRLVVEKWRLTEKCPVNSLCFPEIDT